MMDRIFTFILCLTLCSAALAQDNSAAKGSQKNKKIVFIAGPDSHGKGEHEHNGGCTLLAKALNDSMPVANAVVVHNGWPQDESVLDDADAIVFYLDGGGNDHLTFVHAAKMDKLAAKGVGFVYLHLALEVAAGAPGDRFLKWIGGYFETNWSVNPVWEAHFAAFPDHPVARGVKPFNITDEWYYHMRFPAGMKGVTPILQSLPPESTLDKPDGTHSNNQAVREAVITRKEMQTLAWTFERPDSGRGFGFTGGHMHKNWQNDNFRKLVLNAIAWVAKIDIPADGLPSATPTDSELNALTKRVN
ncbi:ThuA domain-containing protein [Dyadobacter sp. CY261]|uniref:ThuA domain-containing protein n=1 Tax=Dyadobacter sp. CY261 TaxID=2907203 RepID=UPI001F1940A7|nr:ThuA domain-containing protein [Dyadobacter sp. CY261]MCF0073871.1 ThuA domain-containing protein [Dyadobacter sp. CY261]